MIRALMGRAAVYNFTGANHPAIADSRRAHAAALRETDMKSQANALLLLSTIHEAVSEYDAMRRAAEAARTIYSKIGDPSGFIGSLVFLGLACQNKGQYRRALRFYQKALRDSRHAGLRERQGEILNNLGTLHDVHGNYRRARDYYRKSLAIYRQLGDLSAQAAIINNLGYVHGQRGEPDKAMDFHRASYRLSARIGDKYNQAIGLNNIAFLTNRLQAGDMGLDLYRRALAVFRELNDRYGEVNVLLNIGRLFRKQDEHGQSLTHLTQALRIARTIRAQEPLRRANIELGQLAISRGDVRTAGRYARAANRLMRRRGSARSRAELKDLWKSIHRERTLDRE